MTKEEKIKEAWGDNYDEFSDYIDSDGWAKYPNFQKHEMIEDVRPLEFKIQGSDFRPITLRGIETNNRWIKIESEDDLPNNFTDCFIYNGNYIIFANSRSDGFFCYENQCYYDYYKITHYQPIIKPKPPIY